MKKIKQINDAEVVVVGSGLNALGVVRSIGSYYLTALIAQEKSPSLYSKYALGVPVSSTVDDKIIDTLLTIGQALKQKALLLLTEEKAVELVSQHRVKLSSYFILDMPEDTLVQALLSKKHFQQLAEQVGAPVPKAAVLSSYNDIHQVSGLSFPCVLKPLEHSEKYSKKFAKAYKVKSLEEAASLYQDIVEVEPDMIMQEWIEGADSDIYFCIAYFDRNSQCLNAFTGQKLRSWPLNIGGTASCINASNHHEELKELTEQFVKATHYLGLIGIEFKYDQNRKQFFMIEPTVVRTDYQHEVATLSGKNILLTKCDHLLGKNHSSAHQQIETDVFWCDKYADYRSLRAGSPDFDLSGKKQYQALFRWSDIKPQLFHVWLKIKNKLNRT